MACCLSCCKFTAIFGFIFYISMGFIVAFQVDFLKFEPHNQGSSVGACFVTAVLELAIFLGIMFWEKKQYESSISQPQYLRFAEQRALNRQRQSSMKGIDLMDIKNLRRQQEVEKKEEVDLL